MEFSKRTGSLRWLLQLKIRMAGPDPIGCYPTFFRTLPPKSKNIGDIVFRCMSLLICIDQTNFDRCADQFGKTVHVKFRHQVNTMGFDGLYADMQLDCNLAISESC